MRRRPAAIRAAAARPPRRGPRHTLALESLLHRRPPNAPVWRRLPLILALAFTLRAAVALLGDFTLHPDEIMQYLEPAHQLVFGNGILHWEFFYGARSWLLPGFTACILKLFDLAGLGEPHWYVPGVKLAFCVVSLAIPAGMYYFARWHFSELSARAALLAGTFWYELVGFAHKPMAEFTAAALLMMLLALSVRPAAALSRGGVVWLAAGLAVLAAGIRMQYALIALLLLGVIFLRSGRKGLLLLAATLLLLALGVFEALTWNGGLFHSHVTNFLYNMHYEFLAEYRGISPPPYQFLLQITLASAGLGLLCLGMALYWPQRYGLLLVLATAVLLLHTLQEHKEYRFIFAAIPLWLLIGSDLLARAYSGIRHPRRLAAACAVLFTAVSGAGILNALPYQDHVYRTIFSLPNSVRFLRGQPQAFAAFRYLARAPDVKAVWHASRIYSTTPGYYYLHRKLPFYDQVTAQHFHGATLDTLWRTVSHIVVINDGISSPAIVSPTPGYSLEKKFGKVEILRRNQDSLPVREWETYRLVRIAQDAARTVRKAGMDDSPPRGDGIRFADPPPPDPQGAEPGP